MKKRTKLFVFGLIALLVLLCVGRFLFLYFAGKEKPVELSEEEKKTQEWFDVAFETHFIEEQYVFVGTEEENLESLEQLRTQLEELFSKQIEEGVLKSYEEGLFSYVLHLQNGMDYLYSLPYVPGGLLAGGANSSAGRQNQQSSTDTSVIKMDANKGHVLVIDTCSNQTISPNVLKTCGSYITRSDLNYDMTYYGEDDCNDMDKLYAMLTSLDQYDVIILEGHGENTKDKNVSTKVFVAGNVPFQNYENFIKKHPEWDFRLDDKDQLPGLTIGAATYAYAKGNESEFQKRYMKNGKVLETVTVSIDANTIEALYKDGEWKDTIVYLGCCFGGQNDVLPNTILKKGARAVMVYKNALSPEYHADLAPYIFSRLPAIEYDSAKLWTVQAATEKAKEIYGELDPTYADDSFVKKYLLNMYEEEGIRSFLKLYTKDDTDVRMVDYNTNRPENAVPIGDEKGKAPEAAVPEIPEESTQGDQGNASDLGQTGTSQSPEGEVAVTGRQVVDIDVNKYDGHFSSFADGGKTYLSVVELEAEDALYQSVMERLRQEGSEPMQTVLSSCMNLFYIVTCNNGYFQSYSDYVNNQKYVDIGMNYMTNIINSYAKDGGIGYYSVVYIGGHYGNPKKAMTKFMNAMDVRNADATPYTDAELDALELCKMYLTTFYNHREGIEGVGESIVSYSNNFKKNDMNRMLLAHYRESYANGVQSYYDTLALLENYFK